MYLKEGRDSCESAEAENGRSSAADLTRSSLGVAKCEKWKLLAALGPVHYHFKVGHYLKKTLDIDQ